MARADSTIRVNVIGDAKSLQTAARQSEKETGRISSSAKKMGGIIAGAFAVSAVVDFGQTALAEADRVADAAGRLEEQLGDLSQPLIDVADDFTDLGQSKGDMLELQARIADIGTAAGITDDKLAPMATSAAEAAGALALITDMDAATIIDLIGKAAGGSDRPLKDLGINLTDAEVAARAMRDTGKETADSLTDGELAAARMELILEKLAPRVQGVTDAEADLETRQATLDAKFETFTGNVGEALEGPLTDFLTWLLETGEAADSGRIALGKVDKVFDDLEGTIGDAVDILRDFLALLAQLPFTSGSSLGFASQVLGTSGGRSGPVSGSGGAPHPGVTVNVQGGSPEVVQRAVQDAVVALSGRGPTSGSGT